MLNYKELQKRIKTPSSFFKPPLSIGLDIGSTYIKVIAIEKKGKVVTLRKFAAKAINPGNDTFKEVEEFAKSQGISGLSVNTSLSGPSLVMRYISLPRMNKDELKGALQFQAREIIPFPLEEMILDCAITQEETQDSKMQVAVAAVKKSAVEARVELLNKAGLAPNIIDIDCFCLANAFTFGRDPVNREQSANKPVTVGLLNIGYSVTNLVILENEALKFSRDIAFGSREHNLSNLIAEISSSVDYYENQIGSQIEKIYLSGGSCVIPGTFDFISRHLNIPLVNSDVFSGINIDPALDKDALTQKQGIFAVAMGLALR